MYNRFNTDSELNSFFPGLLDFDPNSHLFPIPIQMNSFTD